MLSQADAQRGGSSSSLANSKRKPLSHAQAASCEHLPAISSDDTSRRRTRELLDPPRTSSDDSAAAENENEKLSSASRRLATDRNGFKWQTHLGSDGRRRDAPNFGCSDLADEDYDSREEHTFAPFHVVDRVNEEAVTASTRAPRRGSLSIADLRPSETALSSSINRR